MVEKKRFVVFGLALLLVGLLVVLDNARIQAIQNQRCATFLRDGRELGWLSATAYPISQLSR